MGKENLSHSQLLQLTILFLLGSTVVFGVGIEAKNDAWIAITAGGVIGIGILCIPIGFGELAMRQDYQDFKKIKNHWDESFVDAEVNVHVKVNLRRSGIRTKTLLKS